jgi:hypothetical protein
MRSLFLFLVIISQIGLFHSQSSQEDSKKSYQFKIHTSYGYGLTLGRNNYNYLDYNYYTLEQGQIDYYADSNTTNNSLTGKFGTGNNYSLGVGLLIDSTYNFDIEFNQFTSINNQVGYQDIFFSTYREHNMKANIQSLSFNFGLSKKWNKNSITFSLGPIIGVGSILDYYIQRDDVQREYDVLLKDKFLIGCNASINYKHLLPFGFELFTSCSIRNLTLSPDYIKSDFYDNEPVYFVQSKNYTNENSFLKTSYSLNTINFKLGLNYKF